MANQHSDRPLATPEHLEERRLFIMRCRRQAMIWDRVQDAVEAQFGYRISATQCAEDFRTIMRQRATELNEETDSLRTTMQDQLDALLHKAMERAEDGSIDHMEVAIKLLARKARLLGLDAPLRTETEDKTPALTNLSRAALLDRITAIQTRLTAKMPGQLSEALPTVTDLGEAPGQVVEANIASDDESTEAQRDEPRTEEL